MNTFIGVTYPVPKDEDHPYYDYACEQEERLVDLDEFAEEMGSSEDVFVLAAKAHNVTDVLVMRGW